MHFEFDLNLVFENRAIRVMRCNVAPRFGCFLAASIQVAGGDVTGAGKVPGNVGRSAERYGGREARFWGLAGIYRGTRERSSDSHP